MMLQFDVVELQKINLVPGEVLAVKLIGDDFDADTMQSLKEHLEMVFTKNKIMVFTMPKNSDIVFEAINSSPANVCSDCDCGKKENA